MDTQKQRKSNVCTTGNCPTGIENLKKIGLTPKEKRAIFFRLKEHIFKHKRLKMGLPLI